MTKIEHRQQRQQSSFPAYVEQTPAQRVIVGRIVVNGERSDRHKKHVWKETRDLKLEVNVAMTRFAEMGAYLIESRILADCLCKLRIKSEADSR